MTVEELIEKLKEYPEDAEVYISDSRAVEMLESRVLNIDYCKDFNHVIFCDW